MLDFAPNLSFRLHFVNGEILFVRSCSNKWGQASPFGRDSKGSQVSTESESLRPKVGASREGRFASYLNVIPSHSSPTRSRGILRPSRKLMTIDLNLWERLSSRDRFYCHLLPAQGKHGA